jgi:hypothetical protein
MIVQIAEMLLWLLFDCVKEYGICNVFDHLVYWLGIVYNVWISHINHWCLFWGLLVVVCKISRFVAMLFYVKDEC